VLEDQDHLNEFAATHFMYQGELDLRHGHVGSDKPQGRQEDWLFAYTQTVLLGGAWRPQLGAYFTLPMAFNFCATTTCMQQFIEMRGPGRRAVIEQLDTAAEFRHLLSEEGGEISAGQRFAGRRAGARILHWPGDLRKPWQHCAEASRSPLDNEWWEAFADACAVAPPDAPCSLTC